MKYVTLIAASALAAAIPAAAQAPAGNLDDGQVELLAEMWAMGSICPRLGPYEVRADELAARLNADIGSAVVAQQQRIVDLRDAKIVAIDDRTQEIGSLNGRARETASVANLEDLMTRCQRLTSHRDARSYFYRR